MKFYMLTVMAAVSMGAASAQMMLKSDLLTAQWCCVDSDFKCGDACQFFNDCANQWNACRSQPKTVAQLNMECGTEPGTPGDRCFPVILGGGYVPLDPSTVLGPGQSMFGATTYGEVPAACRANTIWRCCDGGDGYVCGDPHFQTWGGVDYDYQGQCDLKFLGAPKFARGLGLDIHIRTDIKFDYSFISAVAVKLGDSILEVGAWGEYILNGVEGTVKGLEYDAEFPSTMGDNIPLSIEMKSKKTYVFTIDASQATGDADSKIKIQTYKDWVSVHMDYPKKDDFGDSVGMLGSFPEGTRFARDGVTIIEDDNAFGQEWQVLPEEAGLFQGARNPQYPSKCMLPTKSVESQRRLAESTVSEQDAIAACAHLESHQAFCVKDVLATQDLGMADAAAF